MSYKLNIVKTAIDIPVISGDSYPEDPGEADTYMFSAQFEEPFVVDLTFSLFIIDASGDVPVDVPEPITSLNISTPGFAGVTFTVIDSDPYLYKIRVSGVLNVNIGSSSYSFVLRTDDDTKPFPIVTNVSTAPPFPDFLAVFEFVPPTIFQKLEEDVYQIVATPGGSGTLSQYVYWNWIKGIQGFKNVVNSGEI